MQRLLLSTLGFYIAFLFASCAQAQTTIMAETIIDKSQIECEEKCSTEKP